MKKVFIPLVAILVLCAGYAVWTLKDAGPTDAAELVPAETVAFACIPDLPRTASRWPKTTLAKIGAEPEVQAFLERPFQYLTSDYGGNEAAGILWKLKPGRIFSAVVSVTSNDAMILVGFQFWGGKGGHDVAVARLREELSKEVRLQSLSTRPTTVSILSPASTALTPSTTRARESGDFSPTI